LRKAANEQTNRQRQKHNLLGIAHIIHTDYQKTAGMVYHSMARAKNFLIHQLNSRALQLVQTSECNREWVSLFNAILWLAAKQLTSATSHVSHSDGVKTLSETVTFAKT